MKRIISILLVTMLVVATFAGCGKNGGEAKKETESKKAIERFNYFNGLDSYVTLCDLESIKIDTESEDFKKSYDENMKYDLNNTTYKLEKGKVADGDASNINYVGKVDGVAFTGGTAENFNLVIGSGQFIDGFEKQLVGVKIGSTVDIKVTFPADYGDTTDLATGSKTIKLSGTEAVFTVTINYVSRPYDKVNDEFAVALGFKSADDYLENLKVTCIKNSICDYLVKNSTVKKMPPESDGNCYDFHKNYYTALAQQYGYSFEQYLSMMGMDEATFKKEILVQEILIYACLDKLGLGVTDKEISDKVAELAEANSVSEQEIKDYYGENYIEYICVNNKVVNALYEKLFGADTDNAKE